MGEAVAASVALISAGAVSAAGALDAPLVDDSSPFWGPDPEQAATRLVNSTREQALERVFQSICEGIRTIPRLLW